MSESPFPLYVFAFIFGSVVGSFLNVCIYRLPREESIVFPPSHCPSCGGAIRFYHNIPIFGYLALGGKCADCDSRISPVYPLVEALAGVTAAAVLWRFGLTMEAGFYLALIYALIVITFVDIEHMIIPNVITIPGILVGLVFGALSTDWGASRALMERVGYDLGGFLILLNEVPFLDSVFGLLIGGGVLYIIAFLYSALRKREGMGMGDVKLLAMLGAFLGWEGVVFIMLVSSVLGTAAGLLVIFRKKGDLKYALPFGPFLSIAAVIYIFTGGFRALT
ncbi:MAG: prepilin peptidase [Candidatus Dadabacteria bacterium]|nr:prepilin peptidase [Candidatus Dadabacteria bacterium]